MMKTKAELTPGQLIDKLGGNDAVAKLCGVGLTAVLNYRRDGFPPRVHLKLWLAAKATSIRLPPDYFDRHQVQPRVYSGESGTAA